MTRPAKPVTSEAGRALGFAETWSDVEGLLIEHGMSERDAKAATLTRGIETPLGFWIVPAGSLEAMMAEVRRLKALCA